MKSEIRNPKSEGSPKSETRDPKVPSSGAETISPSDSSSASIRTSNFGLRTSDFPPKLLAASALSLASTASAADAPAVKPLAEAMSDPDFEKARAAKRQIWIVARHAGRPGAKAERKAVQAALIDLLAGQPAPVRKEVLWMLSEIGDDDAVAPMAVLLSDATLREDARCALMRLPGSKVTKAFQRAFDSAPEEFKYALAESLRERGKKVAGYPSQKLKPTKQTSLKPVSG